MGANRTSARVRSAQENAVVGQSREDRLARLEEETGNDVLGRNRLDLIQSCESQSQTSTPSSWSTISTRASARRPIPPP